VKLFPGNGTVVINGKPLEEVFSRTLLRDTVLRPLRVTQTLGQFYAQAKVEGGGVVGQAGAVSHGIARALAQADENFKVALRKAGLLTRDPRVKERKKYGLKRARKAPQYTKR
jgi:small subunit ribosomal protein S9